jgi:hypothetical protein
MGEKHMEYFSGDSKQPEVQRIRDYTPQRSNEKDSSLIELIKLPDGTITI